MTKNSGLALGLLVLLSAGRSFGHVTVSNSYTSTTRMADFDASYGKYSGSAGFPHALQAKQVLSFDTQSNSSLDVLEVESTREMTSFGADRDQPKAECVTRVRLHAGTVTMALQSSNNYQGLNKMTQPLILEGVARFKDDGTCATPNREFSVFLQHQNELQTSYLANDGGMVSVTFRLLGLGMKVAVKGGQAEALTPYQFSMVEWFAEMATTLTGEPRTLGRLDLVSPEEYLRLKDRPRKTPAHEDSF